MMRDPQLDNTLQTVAEFSVDYLQFLNESHQATQPLPPFATQEALLALYHYMTLTRALDNKAVNLQRVGKMGTYPSAQGQEAIGVGIGHAMHLDDIFCPYYRDQGTFITRGLPIADILRYWGGDERGSDFQPQHLREDFPICVPIAGQLLHATGVAYALRYRKQQRAVVTICGEGGTSKGDFYEALNVAGARQLPVVFVVNNNQWAISVPRREQTHCQTFAQKAIAGGLRGIVVDGNDVIAVRHAVREAIDNARAGNGPTLIEAVTYRLCDHTTADDASRYRSAEEHKAAWQKEPIARLGYYLESQGWWSKDKEQVLQQQVQQEIDEAVEQYLQTPKAAATEIFQYLYQELPESLLDQYDEVVELSQ